MASLNRIPKPFEVIALSFCASLFFWPVPTRAAATNRTVGPGKAYPTIREAVMACGAGDTVSVDPGTYLNDHVAISAARLLIRGVGGRPVCDAEFDSTHIENQKGILVATTGAAGLVVDNMEFRNARASIGTDNGAGIRIDGGTLGLFTIQNCVFRDNQMNIMAAPESLLVQYCELNHTLGPGNQHNIYVNTTFTNWFTFQHNYSHRPHTGHEVKSRAKANYILYNRLADEDGDPSYNIDIPECGRTYVIGNVIQQDNGSSNTTLLSYGAETTANSNPVHELYVFNNTFVNNQGSGGIFINASQPAAPSDLTLIYEDNIFYGSGALESHKAGDTVTGSNNYTENPQANNARFLNPAAGDYHLTSTTPLTIRNAGIDPGTNDNFNCKPDREYVYDTGGRARSDDGTLDIGAFEYGAEPIQSFFVPQSGVTGPPTEGAAAIANARRCPNDDGTQVLKLNARLKIVVNGADGVPIAGIPADKICVLFNGGTPAQGFSGAGDDSIIANLQYNPLANCPDVRCVQADGPTDASGTTYITWLGATKDGSGNAIRDPFRKWGGYAGDIPVTVRGVPLRGKLTSSSPLGSYTAHVKSLDFVGGRTTALNQGELVNTLDIAPVQAAIGHAYQYQMDFDNNGIVNSVDQSFITAHNNHKCNSPMPN